MHSKAKKHAARVSGSRMAELAGSTESQIRRLGRWNDGAVEGCYLTALPRDSMRSLAGFSPDHRSFFLERAAVVPPRCLQRYVFPFIEKCMEDYMKPPAPPVATGGFLELLLYLRIVITQDTVLLRNVHPALKLWSHPVFNSEGFKGFAADLKEKMLVEQSLNTWHLNEVVPELMDHLNQQQQQTLEYIDDKISEVVASVRNLQGAFTILTSGTVAVRLSVNWGATGAANSELSTPVHPRAAPPASCKLSRSLKTVPQVWQEWVTGINGGLEVNYGSAWRNTSAEKRFLFRRKRIIDRAIAIAQTQNVSKDQAVCALEAQRIQDQLTLNAFSDRLNKSH